MNDRGWIFIDLLVALGLIALVLGFLVPAVGNLGDLALAQEERVHGAMEAGLDDPWSGLR